MERADRAAEVNMSEYTPPEEEGYYWYTPPGTEKKMIVWVFYDLETCEMAVNAIDHRIIFDMRGLRGKWGERVE